ncbi:MAG: hypothetical protein OER21_15445, partial [Gemmatimonadota bacterium]|nr:hypothetical protein [Gemmatimonadota bacterium]
GGERQIDGRPDLYALGCVLYEMLGGQPPFTGPTVESVVHQHLTAEPAPITQLRPAVPVEIAGVLQRALAKNPADRFNPVAQFADALRAPAQASAPARRPVPWFRRVRIVTLPLIAIGAVGAVLMLRGRSRGEPLPTVGRTVQVTREPGLEVDPAISPDGQLVAYASGPATNMQIYVRQVTGGRTVQLTQDSTSNNRWPRWAPDGSRIAYQALDGIYVVPVLGGAPRLIVRAPAPTAEVSIGSFTSLSGLAWSPDGRRIAFAAGYGAEGLYIVNVEGGEPVKLDAPREPFSPAWSPDGTRIAVASGNGVFVFGMVYFANAGASSLWTVPADGGPPRRLTDGASMDLSPQWSPSGRSLYFVSDRGGSRDVYRLDPDRLAEPVRVTTGLDAQTITLSPDATRLAYNRLQSTTNIWSLPIPVAGPVTAAAATPITTGSQTIEQVDVTRDGRWLVFDSDRGSNADLYKLPVTGGEPIQLTTDPAGDFSPVWSPDGTRIAFHSLRTGNRDLFMISADGTGLTRHTSDVRHELDPSWSPDGSAIVAETIDSTWTAGNFIVVPVTGADTTPRVLEGIGDFAEWSPAGDVIAYHTRDGIGLLDPAGGPPRPLVSNAADGTEAFYAAWSLDGRTLYYLARGDRGWLIRAIPRTGGGSQVVVRFDDPARQPAAYGFATDGRRFYFTLGSHEADAWVLDLERR